MKYKDITPWFMTLASVLLVSSGTAFGQRAYLIVDRATGAAEATSSAEIAVHGYSITSDGGNLNVDGWSSLEDQGAAGWAEANPTANMLTELTLQPGGLVPGTNVGIGTPVVGGLIPSQEDIGFQVTTTDGTTSSIVNGYVIYSGSSPVPTITVDRATGNVSLSNTGGFDIDGFQIASANGLLDPASLAELPGFQNSLTSESQVFATNWAGSIGFPNDYDLGNVFDASGLVPLSTEDLTFSYTRPGMNEAYDGAVEYVGSVNDLTLVVDESTGQASIQHMTPNVGDVEITGYSVLSASAGLDDGAWTQLGGDFAPADPRSDALAEINLEGSRTFSNGTSHDLGTIFVGGSRDLIFEYSTPTVDKAFGSVQYVFGADTPGPTCNDTAALRAAAGLTGDLDGNGMVDFSDFLTLSGNFNLVTNRYEDGDIDCGGDVGFTDFLALSGNFGASGAAAASVPEPATSALLSMAMLMGLAFRRKR